MRIRSLFSDLSVRNKMVLAFLMPTFLLIVINLFLYLNINKMIDSLDSVFMSNTSLNELKESLENVQTSLTSYLNTRTTESMSDYYHYEDEFRNHTQRLNDKIFDSSDLILERNIRRISDEYLRLTDAAVEAKRGGNVERYRGLYEEVSSLYRDINLMITSLNNEQFKKNSVSYIAMSDTLKSLELINQSTLIIIGFANIIFIIVIAATITNPIRSLSDAANKVAVGDFNVEPLVVESNDEIGVVSNAFNKMVRSIRDYVDTIKENMETERLLKEKELLMEGHLKDARLKYLQAQVNPHFLFNTLNAGAQLAMMEGADRTNVYIQRVADFFRYNIKKDNDSVSISDEIDLVETYIYILNVRFAGDIHFDKVVDESLLHYKMPSMILQPIVENSVNYGIRNIDWEGHIELTVSKVDDLISIKIADNGVGVSQEVIDSILNKKFESNPDMVDSNGVGLDNVINRLELFFKETDLLTMESEGVNKGTTTTLYLPKREA